MLWAVFFIFVSLVALGVSMTRSTHETVEGTGITLAALGGVGVIVSIIAMVFIFAEAIDNNTRCAALRELLTLPDTKQVLTEKQLNEKTIEFIECKAESVKYNYLLGTCIYKEDK